MNVSILVHSRASLPAAPSKGVSNSRREVDRAAARGLQEAIEEEEGRSSFFFFFYLSLAFLFFFLDSSPSPFLSFLVLPLFPLLPYFLSIFPSSLRFFFSFPSSCWIPLLPSSSPLFFLFWFSLFFFFFFSTSPPLFSFSSFFAPHLPFFLFFSSRLLFAPHFFLLHALSTHVSSMSPPMSPLYFFDSFFLFF